MSKSTLPVVMTILFIIMFGIAMHDWSLGVCLGICMGVAFGLFGSEDDEALGNEAQDEER